MNQIIIAEITGPAWVDMAAAVVTIVSFPIIAWQAREAQLSIRSQSLASVYTLFAQLDLFFIENPELRPYIYGGETGRAMSASEVAAAQSEDEKKDLARNEQSRKEALAEFWTDTIYQAYRQKKALGLKTMGPVEEYISNIYVRSKLLRDFLDNNNDWYMEDFKTLARSGLPENTVKQAG